jgi:hypothetical protein
MKIEITDQVSNRSLTLKLALLDSWDCFTDPAADDQRDNTGTTEEQ